MPLRARPVQARVWSGASHELQKTYIQAGVTRLKRDLKAPMIERRQQGPVDLFRPFGRERARRRCRDSLLVPAHEGIRNHGVKNRVDTISIDVINNHCQFRLSFRSSSVEYWFEEGTGVCGASRFSACELDATDPKVNSGARRQPPGQGLAIDVRMCEVKCFVMCFRDLSSNSHPGTGADFATHNPPIMCKCGARTTLIWCRAATRCSTLRLNDCG